MQMKKQNCLVIPYTIHTVNCLCFRNAVCIDYNPGDCRYKVIPGRLSVYGTKESASFLENITFLINSDCNTDLVSVKELRNEIESLECRKHSINYQLSILHKNL